MVGNPRGQTDTRRIRRLKSPRGLQVEAGSDGVPRRVMMDGVWSDVALVRLPWRIDQHWWRGEAISRIYYRITTQDRPAFTIYHDLSGGTWSRQEY
jgi:hypothetical protein